MTPAQFKIVLGSDALGERDAAALVGFGVERWFKAGAAIGEGNRFDLGGLLLLGGETKLLLDVGDMSLPIGTLAVGDWYGIENLTEHNPPPASLRALTDVKGLLFPREAYLDLYKRPGPALAALLGSMLASQWRQAAAFAPLFAKWQSTMAAKRTPTRKDLTDLGMAKLIAPTNAPQNGRQVELIAHEGAPVAAAFQRR